MGTLPLCYRCTQGPPLQAQGRKLFDPRLIPRPLLGPSRLQARLGDLLTRRRKILSRLSRVVIMAALLAGLDRFNHAASS